MQARMKILRLVLGLVLGLAFFGCVGLPRRRSPTEDAPPSTLAQQRQRNQDAPAPPLRIPSEPTPITRKEPAPAVVEQVSTPRSTAPPTPPAPVVEASSPQDAIRRLHALAEKQHAAIDTYIVCLTRREIVNGKKQPEEVMLFKYRKKPKSVYFKWIETNGKGREALYVEGRFDNKLYTKLAAGDMPFSPAGKVIALAPDSFLVRNNSRHSITEAGVGTLIDRFGKILSALDRGDMSQGVLTYLGKQKRLEFPEPLEGVEWTVPPRIEPSLPKGGRRWCYLDNDTHLPALIITQDERGQEVEYYRYTHYMLQAQLDDEDFNPEKLRDKPK